MSLLLIGQESSGSTSLLWWLIPLLCCYLAFGQREESPKETEKEVETFYTIVNIDESFEALMEKIEVWRLDEKKMGYDEKGIGVSIRKIVGRNKNKERFVEIDKQPPRLYSMKDVTGAVYFELTPVEGGGTVIKITYNPLLKGRMARFKAALPLKIPATPIGLKCPSCGKPVLHEFNLCPYCGTDLIKE
jgi:hypothetical protein